MVATLLVALVVLGVVAAIAVPLVLERMQGTSEAAPVTAADQDLADEIDRELRAIREIDFDHRAGNLSDTDFAELDRAARSAAADLIRRRDVREGRNPPDPG